jgi:phage-related protein (TIGR01555 family)
MSARNLNASRLRRRQTAAVKAKNSTVVSKGGQGGHQDQGARYQTATSSSHPIDRYPSAYGRAREYVELFFKNWVAQKIIEIPVDDMLRKPWTYKGLTPEQDKALRTEEERLKFRRKLKNALSQERLVGGACILVGVTGGDDDTEATPLTPKDIQQNSLKFMNVVSRTRVKRVEYETSPFSADYGDPVTYYIGGVPVHKSRMIIFDGSPISSNPAYDFGMRHIDNDGFGQSVLGPIWDDIIRATGSRQAAFHLIHRASVLILKQNGGAGGLGTKGGDETWKELDDIAEQMSTYQAVKIKGAPGASTDVDQWSATFSSVPELMMTFLQIISAASDIPATRFLGQAPGGLNATGESDLENYYDKIESARIDKLEPALRRHLEITGRSLFGPTFNPETVTIEFDPLWNLSAKEDADTRGANVTALSTLHQDGIITADQYLSEAKHLSVLSADIKVEANMGTRVPEDTEETSEDAITRLEGMGR